MIASGPYATEVSASRESADSPSTGVICSLVRSRARSGGPTSRCQAPAAVFQPPGGFLAPPYFTRTAPGAPAMGGKRGSWQGEQVELPWPQGDV